MDQLTTALFAHAKFDPADAVGRTLVIDPLIDHTSGDQAVATQGMEPRMARVVSEQFGTIKLRPFNADSLRDQPLILMGSIAPVSAPGIHPFTTAPTQTYRMWAVIADLRTHRVISHESVWVRADQVDMTPTAFFRDSPVWLVDHSQNAYLKTCAGHPGDMMDPAYIDGLPAAASVANGIKAYETGHYGEALAFYIQARSQPAGDQLRVCNGIYLANTALRRESEAEKAFGEVVDYGLERGKLMVKFLFRPGKTQFWPDRLVTSFYPMWLRQIALHTTKHSACLRLVGHTSATGSGTGQPSPFPCPRRRRPQGTLASGAFAHRADRRRRARQRGAARRFPAATTRPTCSTAASSSKPGPASRRAWEAFGQGIDRRPVGRRSGLVEVRRTAGGTAAGGSITRALPRANPAGLYGEPPNHTGVSPDRADRKTFWRLHTSSRPSQVIGLGSTFGSNAIVTSKPSIR